MNMSPKFIRHVGYPLIMTVLFFINAAVPATVLGCANRGWVALGIAFCSGIAALVTVGIALKGRISGEPESHWWALSTVVLTIPLIALLILG